MTVRPKPGFSLSVRGRVKFPFLGVKPENTTFFSGLVALGQNVAGVQKTRIASATQTKVPYYVPKNEGSLGVFDLCP